MAQRRHHYERAFEEYLRSRRIPYVAVDEARKALVPAGVQAPGGGESGGGLGALKSFDFVIYGDAGTNLLIDIKGRRVGSGARRASLDPFRPGRLESWVTLEDIQSLERWETLFGPGFSAAFVFVYWCQAQPPDALFQEILEFRGEWYALRAVTLGAYRAHMKTRSPRWGTVYVPSGKFERISQPFAPARLHQGLDGAAPDASGSLFGRRRSGDLGPEVPALLPLGAPGSGYDQP